MNRIEKLQELKQYYSSTLAEDRQNGTKFDCDVLDAIESVEKKYTESDMKKEKKELTEKQKTAKKYALKDFDFWKCSKAMYLFDWQWASLQRSPTADELKVVAADLIDDLFLDNAKSVATGGLRARIENEEGNLLLILEFVLENGQGGQYI